MSQDRPLAEDLDPVGDEEIVIRMINPKFYAHDASEGTRLQSGTVPSTDYLATTSNYGLSVYVESRLTNGIADLVSANPAWGAFGVVRVLASEVRALEIDVRYSPYDCGFPSVAHAHASFIGISNRDMRNRLLALLNEQIRIRPEPQRP